MVGERERGDSFFFYGTIGVGHMSCKRILFFLFPLFGSIIYDDDGSWSSSGSK